MLTQWPVKVNADKLILVLMQDLEEEEEDRRIWLRAKLQSSFQDYGQGLKKKKKMVL